MRTFLLTLCTLGCLGLGLPTTALAAPPAPAAKASAAAPAAAPVDINRASPDELKALKGIGEARASAIVKGRPYARKDELLRRGILPEAVYNDIRERIVARQ